MNEKFANDQRDGTTGSSHTPKHDPPPLAKVAPSDATRSVQSASIKKTNAGVIVGVLLFVILLSTFSVIGFLAFTKYNVFGLKDNSATKMSDVMERDTVKGDKKNSGGMCEDLREYIRTNSLGTDITDNEINEYIADLIVENDAIHTQEEACIFTLFTVIAGEEAPFDEYMSDSEICSIAEKIIGACSTDDITFLHNALVNYFDNAQKNETVVNLKSLIASTVPGAIMCMDDNGFLTTPLEDQEICRDGDGYYGVWSILSVYGGQWGGCDMEVKRDDGVMTGFAYCAILPNGSIAQCTERGCDYDYAEYSTGSSVQNDDADDLLEATDVDVDTYSEVKIGDEAY